jgi:luciferase family oxidoreductase group 1
MDTSPARAHRYAETVSIPTSILDLTPVPSGVGARGALENSRALAVVAEATGYHRYWLAEHHNSPTMACPSPEVMIAHIAAATSTIRVGSGGIMLPNHSPLRIAETFRVLEALHPGRIDLGIGRAPGTDGVTAYALRRGSGTAEDFPQQLAELLAYGESGFPPDHPFAAIAAEPHDVPLPPIWILGSSEYGAQMAAMLGVGFAFARHLNPRGAAEAIALYRDRFTPTGRSDGPRVIVATSAISADTADRAHDLAASMALGVIRLRSGRPAPLPTPEEALAYPYDDGELEQVRRYRRAQVVGTADEVRDELRELVRATDADELMLMAMVHSHGERVHSYRLIADALGLAASSALAGH